MRLDLFSQREVGHGFEPINGFVAGSCALPGPTGPKASIGQLKEECIPVFFHSQINDLDSE